jgi:ABC-2 type transport system ATP-binding protein
VSSADYAIEARQLVKTYPTRGRKRAIRALDGLDISVPRGMIYGLLGPNGAGKTTTVKILTSLARPDSGAARVEGIDVLAQPERVRQVIGVVAQRSGADPTATGRENLMLQGRLYGLRGAAVAARADALLAHFGLTEAGGRLVKTYSGGMQRRLDVSLGLIHRPAVLFLDEPTTGLDPESRTAMWLEVARLAAQEGVTVLLTTHYLEEADALASRIVVIQKGKVIAEGTPEELKTADGSRSIRCVTSLAPSLVSALPGVTSVEFDGNAMLVRTRTPEAVLRTMLQQDTALSGLEVRATALEDAFLALTAE